MDLKKHLTKRSIVENAVGKSKMEAIENDITSILEKYNLIGMPELTTDILSICVESSEIKNI